MDRRPIATRSAQWAKDLARFFAHQNVSPNTISIFSVIFSIISLGAYYFARNNILVLFLAALCIQLRLLCNLFDGMIAVEYNKKSIYGNLYNDIPDRFADVFIILGAGLYSVSNEKGSLNAMDLAWINSILAVLTAYIRVLGVTVGAPMYFSGMMAKPQRMAILTIATLLAMIPSLNVSFLYWALVVMFFGQILTVYKRIKLIANNLKERG